MADSDKSGGGSGPLVREVPVDWEALEDALENNAPEVHSYLHLPSGEVLRVVDGIADPEIHARIASDLAYVRIEPVTSREQYRWMERFIPMVEEPILREQLAASIDGKGAFRRFKDALMSFTVERERWFTFRSERLKAFMDAWLESNHLVPVSRPPVVAAEPVPATEVVTPLPVATQDLRSARRARGAAILRKQLKEIAESLGIRELEKVTAFAEFVKARRVARGFSSKVDGSYDSEYGQEHDESDDVGSDDELQEDAPPSSLPPDALKRRQSYPS